MKFSFFLSLWLILCVFQCSWAQNNNASKPNIIVVYTDDMGIGDVTFADGQVIATPQIDKLAKEGKVFEQYYTNAPVCSPSRVAITTGMYPLRWNINTFLNHRKFNMNCEQSDYLDPAAPTIAKCLKSAGYKTAHFGKWHMGGGRDVDNAPAITQYGFDTYISTYESPDPDPLITSADWIWAPGDSIKRWERTAYFIDKTLEFLKSNSSKPCFINLWPDDVHSPWVASAEFMQEGEGKYYTLPHLKPVIEEYDRQIGRLMRELKKMGGNTLVIFTSDNGPAPSFNRLRTNGLRGIKNSLYEGGIHMPFIAYWPGKIEAGTTDSRSVIAAIDLLPTLCSLAGVELDDSVRDVINGEDFSKALFSSDAFVRTDDIFWEYGRNDHYVFPKGEDRSLQLAIRHGQWKFFTTPKGDACELYDLSADPEEAHDVSAKHPALVKALTRKAMEWFAEYDKEFLRKNP